MADDENKNENSAAETADTSPESESGTDITEEKAAPKKKATRKAAPRKKAAAKKSEPATGNADSPQGGDKSGTAEPIAAASQAKSREQTSASGSFTAQSHQTPPPLRFWPKAIVMIAVVVLFFMFIRQLAKHDGGTGTTDLQGQAPRTEALPTPGEAASSPTPQQGGVQPQMTAPMPMHGGHGYPMPGSGPMHEGAMPPPTSPMGPQGRYGSPYPQQPQQGTSGGQPPYPMPPQGYYYGYPQQPQQGTPDSQPRYPVPPPPGYYYGYPYPPQQQQGNESAPPAAPQGGYRYPQQQPYYPPHYPGYPPYPGQTAPTPAPEQQQ